MIRFVTSPPGYDTVWSVGVDAALAPLRLTLKFGNCFVGRGRQWLEKSRQAAPDVLVRRENATSS